MRARFKGVILAGVHQWAESGLGRLVPRPLVPVVDQPLIEHVVAWMRGAGLNKATVCANSDTATIRRALGAGQPESVAIDYVEDVMPRGPAGCTRDAAAGSDAEFLVVVDTTIIPSAIDLKSMLESHMAQDAALTVAVTRSGDEDQIDNGHLAPAGVYVFSRRAVDAVSSSGYQDIKESLIPKLYAKGDKVLTHIIPTRVPRVSCTSTYLTACTWVLNRRLQQGEAVGTGYTRIGAALVHSSARVDPTVQLVGPVLVGPESSIGAGSKIVGPTSIGPRCKVDPQSILCRSHLWEGARVGPKSVLDRCIVTFGADLPRGTAQSNRVFTSRHREQRDRDDHRPGKRMV